MIFHIYILVKTLPTMSHILVSNIEKINWKYFPQITKALNYVTFNCVSPGLTLGKYGKKEYSQIRTFLFCLQRCDLVQQVQNCFHLNLWSFSCFALLYKNGWCHSFTITNKKDTNSYTLKVRVKKAKMKPEV